MAIVSKARAPSSVSTTAKSYYPQTSSASASASYGRVIVVSEQTGSTAYERLMAAFAAAADSPGSLVIGEPGAQIIRPVTGGASADIVIPSNTTFRPSGAVFTSASSARQYLLRVADDAENVTIEGRYELDCGGTTSAYGKLSRAALACRGGYNIYLGDPVIRNWSYYAILVENSDTRIFKGVRLGRVFIEKPAKGCIHAILARSEGGWRQSEGFCIETLVGWGTDPFNPSHGDYTSTNEFTADFCTVHNVIDVVVAHSHIAYSGSAGYSLTHGCFNAEISDCSVSVAHEPALNIGSGFVMVHVSNRTGFAVSATAVTASGGASGTMWGIIADSSGNGGWLQIDNVTGNTIVAGETITQGAASSGTSAAGAGEYYAGFTVLPSARNVIAKNCDFMDTAITSGGAHVNCINARGDILVHSVRCDRPRGLSPSSVKFAVRNHSDLGVGAGCSLNGQRLYDADDISSAGATSTYVYSNGGTGGMRLEGSPWCNTASAGTALSSKGLSVTKSATGTYDYTFASPFDDDDADYIVSPSLTQSGTSGAGLFITIPAGTRTKTGFQIKVKNLSNTDTDAAHSVVVMR